MNRLQYFIIGGAVLLVSVAVVSSLKSKVAFIKKESEFINTEICGRLVEVEDRGHGHCGLTIRQFKTKRLVKYSLLIGQFIESNQIQKNDSIIKDAGSHVVIFYRTNKESENKPIEYHY